VASTSVPQFTLTSRKLKFFAEGIPSSPRQSSHSGIADRSQLPERREFLPQKTFSFRDVKVNCGTLVEATLISPQKPLADSPSSTVSGACKKAIALANITGAELRDNPRHRLRRDVPGADQCSGRRPG